MLHVLCRMQHSSAYAYVFLSKLTWLSLQLRVAAFVSLSVCVCDAFVKFFFQCRNNNNNERMNFVKWKFQSQEITLWRCCCWQMWWRHGLFLRDTFEPSFGNFLTVFAHIFFLLQCWAVWCLCRNICDLFHWHKTTATTLFFIMLAMTMTKSACAAIAVDFKILLRSDVRGNSL